MNSTFKIQLSDWQTKALIFALALVCLGAPAPSLAVVDPDCDFRLLAPYREESTRIKRERLYTGSPYTERVANHHFIDKELILSRDPNKIYFHVENAVLKILNDKGFLDKEITAATLNMYKDMFFKHLAKSRVGDSLVAIEYGGAYNDFKTIRLVFDTKIALGEQELIDALDGFRREVGQEFGKEMQGFPALAQAYRDSSNPLLKDPAHWHEAGMGRSSAEASLKARMRREADYHGRDDSDLMFGRKTKPNGESVDIAQVAKAVRRVEGDRVMLMHFFSDVVNYSQGGPVVHNYEGKLRLVPDPRIFESSLPTEDLIDILRTAQTSPEIKNHEQYRAYVELSLKTRFGVHLDHLNNDKRNEVIDTLQRYFRLANSLAPSVIVREQEPIGLADISGTTHGLWSFDITGQNRRNLRQVFQALHYSAITEKDNGDMVDAALEMTTEGQQKASAAFWGLGGHLRTTLLNNGVVRADDPLSIQSTGDDFTAVPGGSVTPLQRAKTLSDIADHPMGGGLFRSVLQSQTYLDGSPIRREDRFAIVSSAEGVEKAVRRAVEGSPIEHQIPHAELKEITISLTLVPLVEGRVRVDVDVAARASKISNLRLAQIVGRLERELHKDGKMPSGWTMGTVTAVPQYFENDGLIWTPSTN